MPEEVGYPFHSLSFTLIEGSRPRAALRLTLQDGGMYELHVEKGSASRPTSQFTREVPRETAQKLKDALQDIGVFSWSESYGDAPDAPQRRWTLNTVFKEGVFAMSSKGGSDAPAGFEGMLEEFYRLDFPRPDGVRAASPMPRQGAGLGTALNAMGSLGLGSFGGMSAGDMGAYGAAGMSGPGDFDFSKLGDMLPDDLAGGDMADLLSEMQGNPEAVQHRMRDEFRHLGPEEQNQMLDMLASMGMASRAWWERFLRGF